MFRAGTLSLLPTPRFDKQSPEVVRIRVRPEREITETDPGVDLPIETTTSLGIARKASEVFGDDKETTS